MQVVDTERSERGQQRRRDANGRRLHCCCICGHLDRWNDAWSWYGSIKDEDDGKLVAKFCSEKCRHAAGKDAGNVTEEMKVRAKQAEMREPKLVYREATACEKYNAAVRQQQHTK